MPAVIFGVILVARPALGLVTLVWLIRADAVAIGIARIGLGFWLRRHRGPAGATRSATAT